MFKTARVPGSCEVRWEAVEAGFAEELSVEVVILLPPVFGEQALPGWVERLVEALRRRAPVRLTLVDTLSPRGLLLALRHGGGLPVVVVNGVRVPAWAEERSEEAAERVYEVVLSRG